MDPSSSVWQAGMVADPSWCVFLGWDNSGTALPVNLCLQG